ncbi:antibiotic biosynthesis monooxygenase [Nocardiopsis sp. CNT-189]|uniref:antibiotic biosynthesis monooxygenase family protein n=1 Tax=Nocardiopsis oceanisediminis TaxID=2816862 RepID=UPI003B354CF4
MSGEIRVLLYHSTGDTDGIEAAYHQVSKEMADVPGLIDNELLRSETDPGEFVVCSRWASREDFDRWEQGPEHKRQTAPLRPYRHTGMERPYGFYRVEALYTNTSGARAGRERSGG